MRIQMLETHNLVWPENWRKTTKYKAGRGYTVKRAHGEALVAAGVAKEAKAPRRRPDTLGDWDGDGQPGGDAAATPPAADANAVRVDDAEASQA